MNLIKSLLLGLSLFAFSFVNAQDAVTLTFSTSKVSERTLSQDKWSDWSAWQENKVNITLGNNAEIISIGKNIYKVDRLEKNAVSEDAPLFFYCIDENENPCEIVLKNELLEDNSMASIIEVNDGKKSQRYLISLN